MEWKYCTKISVADAYHGSDDPDIPLGYEKTGDFRPPKIKETFLSAMGQVEAVTLVDFPNYMPRLILRKKQPKRYLVAKWEILDDYDHASKPAGKVSKDTAYRLCANSPSYSIITEDE